MGRVSGRCRNPGREAFRFIPETGSRSSKSFLPIAESLRKFGFDAVLDGEIVVVDDQGHPDFQMLQNYQKSENGHLLYYVFDLLYFQGHDLTSLPLLRRKELLKKVLPSDPKIRFSDHVVERRRLVFQCLQGKGAGRDRRQTFSKRLPKRAEGAVSG